jgi:L-ribulokinase
VEQTFALGLDFGTNSVRCLIVDAKTGEEASAAVVNYPSGDLGVLLDDSDPHLARQSPSDHFQSALESIRGAIAGLPKDSDRRFVGLGVDTTGSSPMPLGADGAPLALNPEFASSLAAQTWLWKDHTSFAEAEEITQKSKEMGRPFLDKCGGTYSSEWWWSKILHCARVAPDVFEAASGWGEMQDVIPAYLTGSFGPDMKRGVCAAGHKAMYHPDWGGLPDEEFLGSLDPRLADLRRRLYANAVPSDQLAGHLTQEHANATGLPSGLAVAVGAFDAHMGAVGAGVKPGVLVKIMGTSTCDIMVGGPDTPDIEGVCGVVPGSVIPGMMGVEAGQSAVGDLFAWCARELDGRPDAHRILSEEALRLRPGESGLMSLDWNNGNRTILVDAQLTGLLLGQTLKTSLAEIYRALIEATAFGSLKIIEQIEKHGVAVREVVCCGGIAEKSPLAMQIYADVTNKPIKVSGSSQTCALGAAMFGAVVGGAYPDVLAAGEVMSAPISHTYLPDPDAVRVYGRLYRLYGDLHDAFGRPSHSQSLGHVMKELLSIQRSAR